MNPSRLITIPATYTPWAAEDVDSTNSDELVRGDDVDLLVWYEPVTSGENVAENTVDQLYRLFLRPDAPAMDQHGQLNIDNGGVFELLGIPGAFTDPRTHSVTHLETTMRRVSGGQPEAVGS